MKISGGIGVLFLLIIFFCQSETNSYDPVKQILLKIKWLQDDPDNWEPKETFDPEELRERLTEAQYRVTQEGHDEKAFTGQYDLNFEKGVYNCIVCNKNLFSSEEKYESYSGYANFHKNMGNIYQKEKRHGGLLRKLKKWHVYKRWHVKCDNCGSHLGYAFPDKIIVGYKRYFINSSSLNFEPEIRFD